MCYPEMHHPSCASFGPSCCVTSFRHGPFFRCYVSKKEEREMLEEYMEHLKKELAGVEERIKQLKTK